MGKKILFLYIELTGYSLTLFKELSIKGYDIYVISRSKNKQSDFKNNEVLNIDFFNKEDFNRNSLIKFIQNINPDLLVSNGWIYKEYLFAAWQFSKSGGLVLFSFDTPWKNSVKQYIWTTFLKIISVKSIASYAWVPGVFQYEYARKMGFSQNQIIMNSYSADISLFKDNEHSRDFSGDKILLFVGRLEKVKGLDKLINSWNSINEKFRWKLKIIGEGELNIKTNKSILYEKFLQPSELSKEYRKAHAFVLPSIYEPWGVVLHEAAASGLPLIASKDVGAASCFLINNYNGFCFSHYFDNRNLINTLKKLICLSEKELNSLSKNSFSLADKITPKTSAAVLSSIL